MSEIELHTGSLTDYIIDYRKGLTSQLINIIDERIDELWALIENSIENSHIDDIYENIEHIVGLGFVVLQQYMTFVYGNLQKKKKEVLPKGPKHKSGNTFARIIDASANYWKHNSEWPLDKPCNRKKKIEAIFKMISINGHSVSVNDEYPLINILLELSHTENRRFNAVFKKILEWRNELNQ